MAVHPEDDGGSAGAGAQGTDDIRGTTENDAASGPIVLALSLLGRMYCTSLLRFCVVSRASKKRDLKAVVIVRSEPKAPVNQGDLLLKILLRTARPVR